MEQPGGHLGRPVLRPLEFMTARFVAILVTAGLIAIGLAHNGVLGGDEAATDPAEATAPAPAPGTPPAPAPAPAPAPEAAPAPAPGEPAPAPAPPGNGG